MKTRRKRRYVAKERKWKGSGRAEWNAGLEREEGKEPRRQAPGGSWSRQAEPGGRKQEAEANEPEAKPGRRKRWKRWQRSGRKIKCNVIIGRETRP